jgi:hypothetical protein
LYLIDGKTGKVIKELNEERFSYVSPLVVDADADGKDEVIWSVVTDTLINDKNVSRFVLKQFDFSNEKVNNLYSKTYCANFASTPHLSLIDKQGNAEIIYITSPAVTSYFPGTTSFQKPKMEMTIHKKQLKFSPNATIKWGNYMGKDMRSHY